MGALSDCSLTDGRTRNRKQKQSLTNATFSSRAKLTAAVAATVEIAGREPA
jgi:hypothetical protein